MMASAGAICFGKTFDEIVTNQKKQEEILIDCYESGHWSVFEFSDWDFQVTGVSRVFENQANRSRHMSPMWESGRHDQEYEAVAIGDDLLTKVTKANIENYEITVGLGTPAEDARYVLPQGVARKARLKRSFRNLMETSMNRLCTHTQAEYRDIMWKMKELVTEEVDPFLGELLQPKCQVQLFCNEKDCCGYKGALTKEEVKKAIAEYKGDNQ
jgi:thymidylate synthase (FAD)